ncbi:hypothetical protein ACFTRD_28435 [Paenibacillus sp. NPDC056933]|uniref:hypothetical protein n=1 Tax=Paenibacillus sp. NPDC056933 TaxID=3345968 RepID=UPI003640019A
MFGQKSGTAEITVAYGDKKVTVQVDVEVPKSLDFDWASLDLELNNSYDLRLYATFVDGTQELITDKAQWSSDDASIADVIKGKVTGYKSGTANIKAAYGGKEATATVRVDIPKQIVLSKTRVDMQIGESVALEANAHYIYNRITEVSALAQWSYSNPELSRSTKEP